LCVFVHRIGAIHEAQDAFTIDHEHGALAALTAVVHHAVGASHVQVGIAEMGKIEAADLVGEAAMGLNAVITDREDLRIQLLEAGVVRLKGG